MKKKRTMMMTKTTQKRSPKKRARLRTRQWTARRQWNVRVAKKW